MKVSGVPPSKSITMSTRPKRDIAQGYKWWNAKDKNALRDELLATVAFLKDNQQFRFRQAAIYARVYGNQSLFNFIGSKNAGMDNQGSLPADRPTMNVTQSCVDTLVSRISQSRPSPVFLTDNGDYKERNLAKKLNNFTQGEFYQTKAYQLGEYILRDALVEGTGCVKVYETASKKVGLERVLLTELFTDPNESIYGEPRQLHQNKLVDRGVLMDMFPEHKAKLQNAGRAYVDQSGESANSISDQVLVVESWHLPSGPDANDGRHVLACDACVLEESPYIKSKFPFVFLHYSARLLGFWAQGLVEQLLGTQMEINALLFTISRAIKLVGVPRIFVEKGSHVVKAHFNNEIGSIITYQGTKPQYEVAQCVPQELYAQLQRLVEYAYQQSGVSALQATSQKPAGLNSGEAIRSYDEISTDRFAALSRRYDNFYIDLAYATVELAKEIAERDGKYSTVFPNKNGTKQIDLPDAKVLKNPFVIQCFNTSSLPRDPSGRMEKIAEMIQSGMITIKEGRRLLDYPDLDQVEKLANASEERIYQALDDIVEDGKFTPPDTFMDLELANDLTVQYYNLYAAAKLEDEKKEMLNNFFLGVQAIKGQMAGPPQQAPSPVPQANPMPAPQSPLIPNSPNAPQPQGFAA